MALSDPQFVVTVADGRVTVTPLEPGVDAPVVFTAKASDADAVSAGELNLSVAYMQGRMKPAGDMAALIRLLQSAHPPEGLAS